MDMVAIFENKSRASNVRTLQRISGKSAIAIHFDIRPWKSGDERAIFDLFRASFHRDLDETFWRWRFLDHPAGGPLIMLAWDGDVLAGQYAASHAPLCVEGARIPASLSMATMTHPDYRGMGLMESLGAALYEEITAQGCAAIWGFPNTFSHTTFQRKLGWSPICDIATLSLDMQAAKHGNSDAARVEIVPKVDARFGDLAARSRAPGTLQGAHDSDILAWRVDANPLNTYTRFILPDGDGIAGYAIAKSYGATDLDIVALHAVDAGAVTGLLAGVREHAMSLERTRLNTWALGCDPARIALERFGFSAVGPVTYFGGRAFDDGLGDFSDPRRWRIAMLDSDLY